MSIGGHSSAAPRAEAKQTGDAGQAGGPSVALLSECVHILLKHSRLYSEKTGVNYVMLCLLELSIVFFCFFLLNTAMCIPILYVDQYRYENAIK